MIFDAYQINLSEPFKCEVFIIYRVVFFTSATDNKMFDHKLRNYKFLRP